MANSPDRPPKWAQKFLEWYCRPDLLEEIEGDLMEIYEKQKMAYDNRTAGRGFMWNVVRSFRLSTIRNFNFMSGFMFRSNLKIAYRQMSKRKILTGIKIGGFILGLVPSILISLFIKYESSFDQGLKKVDTTYRVVQHTKFPEQTLYWNTTAYPLAAALRQDIPDFNLVSQTAGPQTNTFSVKNDEGVLTRFEEDYVLFVDSLFANVFDPKWLFGDPALAFNEPNSVVLTESVARKYFGDKFSEDFVMGKIITLEEENPLVVTGVVKDPPGNTTLRYQLLIPYSFFKEKYAYFANNWSGNYQGSTFVVLPDNSKVSEIELKIASWKKKYLKPEDDIRINYFLQPLSQMHTDSKYGSSIGSYIVPDKIIRMAFFVAIFILLMSVVNFVNLVTAQSSTRFREVGVRRVIGATRVGLFKQFIVENSLLVLLAVGISLILVQVLLSSLNNFLSIINLQLAFQIDDIGFICLIAIGTIVISTVYPAFALASFQPVKILKDQINLGNTGSNSMRRILVIGQFVLVQVFVISALILSIQMNHFHSVDLGFSSDAVLITPSPEFEKQEIYRSTLLQNKDIAAIAFGSGPPMAVDGRQLGTTFRLPQQAVEEGQEAEMKIGDVAYLDFYNLKLIAGRNFRESREAFDEFIINEKLLHALGWTAEDAIGRKLAINEGEATVVGVVADYHNNSLQYEITPTILLNWTYFQDHAFVKAADGQPLPLDFIERKWKDFYTTAVYSYGFLDQAIAREYLLENLITRSFKIFSVLVILIGCLGLFGLMSFNTLRKRKEMGIRKVLGATPYQIVGLYSRESILLISVAFIIAAPIVYMMAKNWLNNFTHHMELSFWVFLAGGLGTLGLAMMASGAQTIKAAMANPVDSLKI